MNTWALDSGTWSMAEVAPLPGFLSSHHRAEGPVLPEFKNPVDEACLGHAPLFLVTSDALVQRLLTRGPWTTGGV